MLQCCINLLIAKIATFSGSANDATILAENHEFSDILQGLDFRYVVPGRTIIGTELSKIITNMKKNTSQELIKT